MISAETPAVGRGGAGWSTGSSARASSATNPSKAPARTGRGADADPGRAQRRAGSGLVRRRPVPPCAGRDPHRRRALRPLAASPASRSTFRRRCWQPFDGRRADRDQTEFLPSAGLSAEVGQRRHPVRALPGELPPRRPRRLRRLHPSLPQRRSRHARGGAALRPARERRVRRVRGVRLHALEGHPGRHDHADRLSDHRQYRRRAHLLARLQARLAAARRPRAGGRGPDQRQPGDQPLAQHRHRRGCAAAQCRRLQRAAAARIMRRRSATGLDLQPQRRRPLCRGIRARRSGPMLGESRANISTSASAPRIDRGPHTLSLSVTNLLDEEGNRFAVGSPFTLLDQRQITPLRPRTLRLGWQTRF